MFNPRVALAYTYMMARFLSHCYALMLTPERADEGLYSFSILKHTLNQILLYIRQDVRYDLYYNFSVWAPNFSPAIYDEILNDETEEDGYLCMSAKAFSWLVSIKFEYLVYRLVGDCGIESYMPFCFARQLGYYQLFIGNPNPELGYVGSLLDGARAWYWNIASATLASYKNLIEALNFQMSLAFCKWFAIAF